MKELWLKFHLEIYTAIVVITVILAAINVFPVTPVRFVVLIILVLGMLHEWEEKRFLGGFFEKMGELWGWDMEHVDMRKPGSWVIVAWFALAYIPLIFCNVTGIVLGLLILGVFEMFIHTAGKWIAQIKGPYVPGIITAWLLGIASIWGIVQLNSLVGITAVDVLIGFVFFAVIMGLLQFNVQRAADYSIPQMAAHMRQRFGK